MEFDVLYDLQKDPHEMKNLACAPEHGGPRNNLPAALEHVLVPCPDGTERRRIQQSLRHLCHACRDHRGYRGAGPEWPY